MGFHLNGYITHVNVLKTHLQSMYILACEKISLQSGNAKNCETLALVAYKLVKLMQRACCPPPLNLNRI